jgi:multidrug transporter EmrE-like cation transporter
MIVLLYILISGVLSVSGQIILKRGLAQLGPLELAPDTILSVILNCALTPSIMLGLAVTVTGTFFWLITLSRVDLSFAYPFASLNYVMVLAGSWLVLGEALAPARLLGVLAICAGVCLVARSPHRSPSRLAEQAQPVPAIAASAARHPV